MFPLTLTPGGRAARRWCQETGFSGGSLVHEVRVEPGPGSRPGERLLAPSRSFWAPTMGPDETRADFRVVLDRRGSLLSAVCLHPLSGPEHVEESAWHSLSSLLRKGFDSDCVIVPRELVGEAALGYTIEFTRRTLTDWKLAHEGWLYVIGVLTLRDRALHERAVRRSLDVLETWRWLPARS